MSYSYVGVTPSQSTYLDVPMTVQDMADAMGRALGKTVKVSSVWADNTYKDIIVDQDWTDFKKAIGANQNISNDDLKAYLVAWSPKYDQDFPNLPKYASKSGTAVIPSKPATQTSVITPAGQALLIHEDTFWERINTNKWEILKIVGGIAVLSVIGTMLIKRNRSNS